MKAIFVTEFGPPEVLKCMDVDIPSITPSQVLIRVVATSVNFADIKARYGKKDSGKLPFIPGLDVAGVVVQVGSDVQRFTEGQRVIAFPKSGSYAEYVVAEEVLTFAIPDHLDFDTAAACPVVSFTAFKLLADVAKVEPGETVLIHAKSGVPCLVRKIGPLWKRQRFHRTFSDQRLAFQLSLCSGIQPGYDEKGTPSPLA